MYEIYIEKEALDWGLYSMWLRFEGDAKQKRTVVESMSRMWKCI